MKTDAQIELNISGISLHAAYMRKKPLESFYYHYFFSYKFGTRLGLCDIL